MINKLEEFLKFVENNNQMTNQQKLPYQKQAKEIISYLKAQQITEIEKFNVDNFLETYEGDLRKQMVKGMWIKILQWMNGQGFPVKTIEEVEVVKKRKAEKKKLKKQYQKPDDNDDEQIEEEEEKKQPKPKELIQRSNDMPQHKLQDKDILGTGTKIHIYKRDNKAKLAFIEEYEMREIAPDGNIERFVKDHLVSKYGGGIYEIYRINSDGSTNNHLRTLKYVEDNLNNTPNTDFNPANIYNQHKEELVRAIEEKHAEKEKNADKMLELLTLLQKPNSSPTDALVQLQVLDKINEYMERMKSNKIQADSPEFRQLEEQFRQLKESLIQKPQQQDNNSLIPIMMMLLKDFKEKPVPVEADERFGQVADAINNLRDDISNINPPQAVPIHPPEPGFMDKITALLPIVMPFVSGYLEQQRAKEEKMNQQLQDNQKLMIEVIRGQNTNPELVRIIDKLESKLEQIEEKVNNPGETSITKILGEITALKQVSGIFGGEKSWVDQIGNILGAFAQMQAVQKQQPQQQLLQQPQQPQQSSNGGNGKNLNPEQLKVLLDRYVLDILEAQKNNPAILKNMKDLILSDDQNRMNTLAAILQQYAVPITEDLLISANNIIKQNSNTYIEIIDKNLSILQQPEPAQG
ncbi:MAG: hypothetical protein WC428_05755 [Candidatus Paceibacterota bacterium]|jgi:hypothetical protein